MKTILFPLLILAAVATAEEPSPRPPVMFRPSYRASSEQEDNRFASCENVGGSGFYWLDTTNANLWQLDPAIKEWVYLGSPRGANTSRKGTYAPLSDRNGGLYILNTETGEGWWTDGAVWKELDEPSRRMKQTE